MSVQGTNGIHGINGDLNVSNNLSTKVLSATGLILNGVDITTAIGNTAAYDTKIDNIISGSQYVGNATNATSAITCTGTAALSSQLTTTHSTAAISKYLTFTDNDTIVSSTLFTSNSVSIVPPTGNLTVSGLISCNSLSITGTEIDGGHLTCNR